MNSHSFYFTPHAAKSLKRMIEQVQEVSLLSAEKLRARIFHKLHLIHHHPVQGSKRLDLAGVDAHIRLASVLNYRIYFKLENERIIVLEILSDKGGPVI
jgi:plasmid stabilization system protein ParE